MKCRGRSVFSGEFSEISFGPVITGVDPVLGEPETDEFLAPGFIDLQVNGLAGADYNDPDLNHAAIEHSLLAAASTGVTRLFPTVITAEPERMLAALRNLSRAKSSVTLGGMMEGFHVEGPHISPEDGPRGAHPVESVRPPDLDEYKRWQEATEGNVRLVTLAPEWPGANAYIERLSQDGVVTSIGHTRASGEQIQDAVSAGATLSTHLGNGADRILPRHPNYIWEQLGEDKLAASFIADGIHLGDSFLRASVRAKGAERSILVTDAVAPAMCAPGLYRLGPVEVELLGDGRVVMRGGTRLAGSSLRMDHAISNVMRAARLSLRDAVVMATMNPARVGRVAGRRRGIEPGERADLVRFRMEDGAIKVVEVFVSGEKVYTN